MKRLLWLVGIASAFVCACAIHARESEGSRVNSVLLNGAWEYRSGEGDEVPAQIAGEDKGLWREVTLPGPFMPWNQEFANKTKCVWARRSFQIAPAQANQSLLQFRVSRPGHTCEIQADLARGKATLKRIDLNAWGVMRILHTFTGVRMDDARNQRDWVLISAWAWTMDAVAVGLILLVFSSLIMWWERPPKRRWGIVVLAVGSLSCGLFCLGLRWLL